MQERHTNRKKYFEEQGITTSKYVIPYIESIKKITADSQVMEIGCGEGGNLNPFLSKNCQVIGIELLYGQYSRAIEFYQDHPLRHNLKLIHADIYQINPDTLPAFDIIFMKDVIEHIPDQLRFLNFLRQFLKPDGIIFFGFPPWRMPFGGHQQVCNSILSKVPYFHILPAPLYRRILHWFGESEAAIQDFLEVKSTGLSIQRFHDIIRQNNYKILKETFWFINPNYEIKFGLSPRVLPSWLRVPWLVDFYTTALYAVISKK